MRIKTMVMILIAVLLTVVVMQNTDAVPFKFLWAIHYISKLWMLLPAAAVGFIIGVMVGRPGRPKYIPGHDEDHETTKSTTSTLSDEDKNYIN